jgi:hypothetical protein
MQHGCVSGMVSMLVYYKDTDAFFKKHFEDIFDLYNETKEECGVAPEFELNANNLAWFGYEETVRRISNQIDLEY